MLSTGEFHSIVFQSRRTYLQLSSSAASEGTTAVRAKQLFSARARPSGLNNLSTAKVLLTLGLHVSNGPVDGACSLERPLDHWLDCKTQAVQIPDRSPEGMWDQLHSLAAAWHVAKAVKG